MGKPGRLSAKQEGRLIEIGMHELHASWWDTPTDRSLLKRGLIERCDRRKQLAPQVAFVTHLCRITEAGRSAIRSSGGKNAV